MRLKMLSTHRGSENGFDVNRFFKDGIYDICSTLACYFIRSGWAVETSEPLYEPSAEKTETVSLASANAQFDKVFRPQSVRPTNISTLLHTGKLEAEQ